MDDPHTHIPLLLTIGFFLLTTLPQSRSQDQDTKYSVCGREYSCGGVSNISYPFWGQNRPGYCGSSEQLQLNCDANQVTSFQFGSQNFTVLDIDTNAATMRMVRTDLAYDVCSSDLTNTSLSPDIFEYPENVENISIFYGCPKGLSLGGNNFTCRDDGNQLAFFVRGEELNNFTALQKCERCIQVLVSAAPRNFSRYTSLSRNTSRSNSPSVNGGAYTRDFPPLSSPAPAPVSVIGPAPPTPVTAPPTNVTAHDPPYIATPPDSVPPASPLYVTPKESDGGIEALRNAAAGGFDVHYKIADDVECRQCKQSKGACGTNDAAKYRFSCHCPDGSDRLQCYGSRRNKERKIIIIGVAGAAIAGLLIFITIFCFRYKSSTWQGTFRSTTKSNQHIEAFLKNNGALTLKRYKFSEVKKMTNSFKVKLGQGGFGAVYKGQPLTGCPVAVKMLNVSKKNGEEFINEVASISRTSHVNIVTLLGFCLEGRKKALIYEFVPNGSLEKFIYKTEPAASPPLSWENLYQISIGIARGLEYLHRGCKTRILHFDIKPHNILLDENFCPKISDFGLAKLCPREQSIISMSDARGTMGYVAPEVLNRHFGRVSYKSDVYSYGMMLLEMVGGRKNINAEASHTSEIYFPHWIYKRLEKNGENLELDGVVATEENEIARRLSVVGLWCIQTIPHDRPTMGRVIEMLEGSMNSFEMPPKPLLSSPTRSVAESSITLN